MVITLSRAGVQALLLLEGTNLRKVRRKGNEAAITTIYSPKPQSNKLMEIAASGIWN